MKTSGKSMEDLSAKGQIFYFFIVGYFTTAMNLLVQTIRQKNYFSAKKNLPYLKALKAPDHKNYKLD